MKTQDKIKKLCKEKYNMPISVYEKKLGYANGSLTKGGNMYSIRLFAVARDLGVTMESLIDDDILAAHQMKADLQIPFSEDEIELVKAFRTKSQEMQDGIRLMLGLQPLSVEKKAIGKAI